MAKQYEDLVKKIVAGEHVQLTNVDAKAIFKKLGFKDNTRRMEKESPGLGRAKSNRTLYIHPLLEGAESFSIPKDNILMNSSLNHFRDAIEKALAADPKLLDRLKPGYVAQVTLPDEVASGVENGGRDGF